jgi:hypothetical protein
VPAAPAAVATAGLFLGALVLGNLAKLMVIGGGLWLGATVAQRYFLGGGRGGDGAEVDPDGTIDVEAETLDDEDSK